MEQRVTKLREQLDKRKAAQKAIIDLRLQTIVNDADGLGFAATIVGGANPFFLPRKAPLYQPGGETRAFPSDLDLPINRTEQ